jgi:hypothetical protein
MIEKIEQKEDAALLRVLEDIGIANDEVMQNRAIDRFLKLSIAIAIKNGEFNPAAYTTFAEQVLTQRNK